MIESQPNISQQPIQFERKPPKKPKNSPKNRWSIIEIEALYALPFSDLMFKAQSIHRENFDLPSDGVYTLTLIDKESGNVVSRERFTGKIGENIKKIYTNSLQSQYLYLLLQDVTSKEIGKTTIITK